MPSLVAVIVALPGDTVDTRPVASTVATPGLPLLQLATGARTVTGAAPALPSLVAEMVALPPATAVTRPLLSTVAAAALLELQLTVLPFNWFPAASLVVAVS